MAPLQRAAHLRLASTQLPGRSTLARGGHLLGVEAREQPERVRHRRQRCTCGLITPEESLHRYLSVSTPVVATTLALGSPLPPLPPRSGRLDGERVAGVRASGRAPLAALAPSALRARRARRAARAARGGRGNLRSRALRRPRRSRGPHGRLRPSPPAAPCGGGGRRRGRVRRGSQPEILFFFVFIGASQKKKPKPKIPRSRPGRNDGEGEHMKARAGNTSGVRLNPSHMAYHERIHIQ